MSRVAPVPRCIPQRGSSGSPGPRPGLPRWAALLSTLLAAATAAPADPPPSSVADAIRAHVSFLADDLLEGRASGTRGYDLAARYVASSLQQIGLQPAGAGGWTQPVSLLESLPVVAAARATIRRDGERIELLPGRDFIPLPSHLAAAASVSAPLTFVGYGIAAPESGYDDFDGMDVRGKVALVLPGAPPAVPADRHVHYSKDKARQLAERGVVGLVHIPRPGDADPGSWDAAVARTRVSSLRLLDESGRPRDAFPGLEAAITLDTAAARRLFAGSSKPLERIWQDAAAGLPQSFDLPASISIRTRSALRTVASANVVGVLEGSDPQRRNEYVVLMAHLDHVGRGTPVRGDAIYNGALDNASGVAVMLEAARLLVAEPARPARSILFLAVTAEERGLLGSRHFALHPTIPRGSIVAAVNLDMPVALYPAAGYTVIGAEHSTLGEPARRALEAEGLRALPNQAPERGLFAFTDQYSFVREGIPALYLHDGPVSADPSIDGQRVFDGFLRQHYHQPSDQADLPIDWDSLARLARVHARLCREIADAEERPRWVPGDFYGERFKGAGAVRPRKETESDPVGGLTPPWTTALP